MKQTLSALHKLFPNRAVHWVGPLIAAGVLACVVAISLAGSGVLDLSATTPHPQGWAQALHYVFLRSTTHHAGDAGPVPDLDSPALIAKGATYYQRNCSHCHGAPGMGQSPIALSMRPQPPYLVASYNDLSPGGLFRVIDHGIKYSGMPAWPTRGRGDEVWAAVAFVRAMPRMASADYLKLAWPPETADIGATKLKIMDTGAKSYRYAMPIAINPGLAPYGNITPAVGFEGGFEGGRDGDPIANCAQCHGFDGAGRGSGAFPNIALLNASYIKRALVQYRSGARVSGYMQPVAVELSDGQIDAIAQYFARQPKRQSVGISALPEVLAVGGALAARGDAKRGVPACASCHGEVGASPKGYSAIDGQYPTYLRDQIKLFRSSIRGAGSQMAKAAHALTDREIDAVSLYYAAGEPGAARIRVH